MFMVLIDPVEELTEKSKDKLDILALYFAILCLPSVFELAQLKGSHVEKRV